MNPLTLVKRIQNINTREAALGISEDASWHAKYKDSAYVFVGGIPFDLTEGDLLAVFAQYGEIVDVNLVRDKGTGKSKGFAFIAYEDQRSTNLAVDNLNGAQVLGRVIRVDHVTKYKKKEEEDEEAEQQKREARGVCRAFQKGECNRGAGCKFSHDEQRAANTGWGAEDKSSRWGHDKFDGPRSEKKSGMQYHVPESKVEEGFRMGKKNARHWEGRGVDSSMDIEKYHLRGDERNNIDNNSRELKERPKNWQEGSHREDRGRHRSDKRSRRHDTEPSSRDDYDEKEEKGPRPRMHESESSPRDDRDERERERVRGRRLADYRDSSSRRHRER